MTSNKKTNAHKGFTLIELCIVMIITGIVLSAAASAYTLYRKDKSVQDTKTDITTIAQEIGSFRAAYGRYPCPSSLTAQRTDPDYGHEATDKCETETIAVGTCSNGICVQESPRTVQFQSAGILLPPEKARVRVGFVPFRALNLTEEQAYDGYYNRYKYVVTERLAVDHTFTPNAGGIEILNDQNDSIFTQSSSAHFLIISAGEDGGGSFTQSGVQITCPNNTFDADNCKDSPEAVYRLAETRTKDGTGHFDDVMQYFTRSDVPLWQESKQDKWAIHQKPSGYIAFLSAPDSALDESFVEGAIRADKIMADNICSADGTNCFPSSLLAGQPGTGYLEGIQCPPGEFLVAIGEGNTDYRRCQPVDNSVELRCPAGQYMIGINTDGTLKCDGPPPSNCPATDMGICDFTETLSTGSHGSYQTISGGANAWKKFRCQDGAWVLDSQGGSCTCTETTKTRTTSCDSGFTGTVTQERTYTCPAGTWGKWTTISENCTCDPLTEEMNDGCPWGYDGYHIKQRTHICPDDTWTAWTTKEDTCTCTPKRSERTVNCSGGLTGSYRQEQFFTCPDANWSKWSDIDDPKTACTCEEKPQQRNVSCPTGYIGQVTEERNFQCPQGKWSKWAEVSNTCEPEPVVTCHWKTTGSGRTGQSSRLGKPVGNECTCGDVGGCYEKSGSEYINYTGCACQ